MELRTISPARDYLAGQLEIKAREITADYENLLRYGYKPDQIYALCAEALNAETKKALPYILSDVPVYVLVCDNQEQSRLII